MLISEMIARLREILSARGDVPVYNWDNEYSGEDPVESIQFARRRTHEHASGARTELPDRVVVDRNPLFGDGD